MSTYRKFRLALAKSPGSRHFLPLKASSKSRDPSTLSSVLPTGTWMISIGISSTDRGLPVSDACLHSRHMDAKFSGSQPYEHPLTRLRGGRSSVKPRTMQDFPVPLGPEMSMPPISGSTAPIIRASLTFCCPMIAVKGYGTPCTAMVLFIHF